MAREDFQRIAVGVLCFSIAVSLCGAVPSKTDKVTPATGASEPLKVNGNGKEGEFSSAEFYSIKRSVLNMKLKESSSALKKAQEVGKKLSKALPTSPVFYGHDHYEQSHDGKGREVWTHVGRPVRVSFLRRPLAPQ